ncbi:dihydroorotase [Pilibacter termitis]|uniref:Dihydroorotase n=1 Tax=Pilibacter termitis TaxID=263852 RepID=A0A1T4KF56_9ENTE|nr:dihydroorotase [Pilibacter termitis]SJZ41006.1 dihydroorotase [Pilibacter termitis]
MKFIITNGKIVEKGNTLKQVDILVTDGKIQAIGKNLLAEVSDVEKVYDVKGALITPGLVDLHVHFRQPGFEYKETIQTGSLAAAHGGYTTVCAMPNLNPTPDTPERVRAIYDIIKRDASVKVLQYATITENLRSGVLVDYEKMVESGAFAFSNDGVGVQTAGTMYLAMKEAAKLGKAIVAHVEDESLMFGGVMHKGKRSEELGIPGMLSVVESSQVARDVLLAESTGVHYHVCHVSTKESVRVIRDAKRAGIHVTCEVCPHHLILADEDIPEDNATWKMNPPLPAKEDQMALIEGVLDGTIDVIATDHAPHAQSEKVGKFTEGAFGIVGSENAFELMFTHFVETGIITLEKLIDLMSIKPAELFDIPTGKLKVGDVADIAVFDIENEITIDPNTFESKGVNTPFVNWKVKGDTLLTFVEGKLAWGKEEYK